MHHFLYRHFNSAGELLYIGVSLSAVARLSQHRDQSHWYHEIARVEMEKFKTREAALKAEREAIIKERPKHNTHHNKPVAVAPEPVKLPTAIKTYAEKSRWELTHRTVNFKPVYRVSEAAQILNIGQAATKRAITDGKLGHIMVDGFIRVTGWQIIDYIEWLESQPPCKASAA